MHFKRKHKHTSTSTPEPEGVENIAVQENFSFEHRSSEGKLLATNKNLKAKNTIKDRLKRILKLA